MQIVEQETPAEPENEQEQEREREEETAPAVAEVAEAEKQSPQLERDDEPLDPGAEALVGELLAGLGEQRVHEDGTTRICISRIRNLSRTEPEEFREMLDRFADVLSRSGRSEGIIFFVRRDDRTAHYEMRGTAYIMTAEGLDTWELFLRASPTGSRWTAWSPSGPVRMPREHKPGEQQIFMPR